MASYLSPAAATESTNTGMLSAVASGGHKGPSTTRKELLSMLITFLSTPDHFTYLQFKVTTLALNQAMEKW